MSGTPHSSNPQVPGKQQSVDEPQIICLTPCKDEAWFIDTFLAAASCWADHIVVGDQMSTDGMREIVRRYPKAILVDNHGIGYDEGERHRVVFERARQIPGQKILLAIDADEVLSANWMESEEWKQLRSLPAGTAIYGEWVNLDPGFKTGWPLGGPFIVGYVDDGLIGFSPGKFHVSRLLPPPHAPRFDLREIRLLHYQYTDPRRSRSKARNYQVQEWLTKPERPIRLYRRLRPRESVKPTDVIPLKDEWFSGYAKSGIDIRKMNIDGKYRWDRLVLDALVQHGPAHFRKLDIWDMNWEDAAREQGVAIPAGGLADPRSRLDKWILRFLRLTQPYMGNPLVRACQQLLRPLGW